MTRARTTAPATRRAACGSAPWRSTSARPSRRSTGSTPILVSPPCSPARPSERARLESIGTASTSSTARRGRSMCSTSTRSRAPSEGRRRFAAVEVEGAVPDGLSVDAEGGVWVALHGGWGLRRFAPDGELAAGGGSSCRARHQARRFGGADLRDLYVTTRRAGPQRAAARGRAAGGRAPAPHRRRGGLPTHAFAG